MVGAVLKQDGPDILEHRINAMGHGLGTLGTRDEARQARDDDDAGLLSDGRLRRSKNPKVATWDNLCGLQRGIVPAAGLVDMTLDVRVAHEGKHPILRHRPRLRPREARRNLNFVKILIAK